MKYELKDQIHELEYNAICARGDAEAVEMVLCELLSILKENSPQQFETLKKNCNEIKESKVEALGEIGEYDLEVYASSFAEKCDNIFYDESEHFSEEELLMMSDPSLIGSQ
ncbi:hypothetical protein C9J12_21210 [Photobacterium frigidiphilum]|uniref:Uncharacterized protein n=1 Tax=Photobacterium frigidiphilum TaxID=264736 RepID=A0A2T3JAA3_9GAMM|nr:hypothetical protein [Photobacterium frigidiphilum]PSU45762.1 hypothetical protein C9J12_21210 [Photobacterium frigidiphilum]